MLYIQTIQKQLHDDGRALLILFLFLAILATSSESILTRLYIIVPYPEVLFLELGNVLIVSRIFKLSHPSIYCY